MVYFKRKIVPTTKTLVKDWLAIIYDSRDKIFLTVDKNNFGNKIPINNYYSYLLHILGKHGVAYVYEFADEH